MKTSQDMAADIKPAGRLEVFSRCNRNLVTTVSHWVCFWSHWFNHQRLRKATFAVASAQKNLKRAFKARYSHTALCHRHRRHQATGRPAAVVAAP